MLIMVLSRRSIPFGQSVLCLSLTGLFAVTIGTIYPQVNNYVITIIVILSSYTN